MPATIFNRNTNRIPGFFAVVAMMAGLIIIATVRTVQRPIIWQPGGPALADHDPEILQRWPDGKLDINRATEAELCVLPGIGPALAQRIIADREANGPFSSVDDLDRVRGIGLKTIEWFRRYAVVREFSGHSGDDF